jgi:UDP-glucose 4-epimerase
MKFLVTGCAGFLGSNIVGHLLKNADNYVIGIDNFLNGKREYVEYLSKSKQFEFNEFDCRSTDDILNLPKPDSIIHLAANSDIAAAISNPLIDYELGIETTQAMLEYARRAGVKNFIFSSGSGVYGENPNLVFTEDSFVGQPTSTYGATKLASEALISAYSSMFDIRSTVFRFSNLVGPQQTHGVIYDFLLKLAKNQETLEVLGNGTQLKPYIHVSDALSGIDIALKNQEVMYEVFNVSNNSSTTVSRIAEMVLSELDLQKTKIIYQSSDRGWKADIPKYSMSSKKLFKFGWKINYVSDEAVKQSINQNKNLFLGL